MRNRSQREPKNRKRRIKGCRRASCVASRAGFSLTELIVAAVLLGTVFAVALPSLRWVGVEQRHVEHRQLAMAEVENLMDRIASQPWNAIGEQFAKRLKISDEAQKRLPDAMLDVVITPAADANSKRISVALAWRERKSVSSAPVRLTTWVYRGGRPE